jgi:transposase
VAHIKLAASRAFLLVAYFTQTHEMLFDAHARGFAVFGGVAKRGIYDNMKTAGVGHSSYESVGPRSGAHQLIKSEAAEREVRSMVYGFLCP